MTTSELRNSTTKNYVIFLDEFELVTKKAGAINSAGGIVLTAFVPEIGLIQHRSNDSYGRKGFSLFDTPFKSLPNELRNRLEYKY